MDLNLDVTEAYMREAKMLPPERFYVGVDLGQSQDWTAIAVCEKFPYPAGPFIGHKSPAWSWQHRVRHLERLPLGMSYVDQIAAVKKLLETAPLARRATLVLDFTGVGRPVADLARKAGLRPVLIGITGGSSSSEQEGDRYSVSKVELVSRLQALLHEGRLKIAPDLELAETLRAELNDFRVEFSATGQMTFNARSGRHDDLVLAVAIAAWYAVRDQPTKKFEKWW
jgi:hypothetical protein